MNIYDIQFLLNYSSYPSQSIEHWPAGEQTNIVLS